MCEHGAEDMDKDVEKLGFKEIIFKSNGEPALKRPRRNAGGGIRHPGEQQDGQVKLWENGRVICAGLQSRLDIVIRGSHPVMTWLVQHAAEGISKCQVGEDGKTEYERLTGKPFSRPAVELGVGRETE